MKNMTGLDDACTQNTRHHGNITKHCCPVCGTQKTSPRTRFDTGVADGRETSVMPGVPNLRHIYLSDRVHLRLAIEGKIYVHIIYFEIVIHISVNIVFKNHFMLIV